MCTAPRESWRPSAAARSVPWWLTTSTRFSEREARVKSFLRFTVQKITTGVTWAALETRQRFGIPYWDAAIIEAGRALGCNVVLSEDLSDGKDYAGVRVENPFREGGELTNLGDSLLV